MQVYQLVRVMKVEGDVGVEIEVEGHGLPNDGIFGFKYWNVERDGSLRGESCEFVLKNPLSIEELPIALGELDGAYRARGSVVHDSVRAGVHVHVNVQELTFNQLFNFIACYYILEEVLVHWCGPSREGNLFCLRCRDAEGLFPFIKDAVKRQDLRVLHADAIRYSSLNLKALAQYGSVEFRAMRGTRDLGLILDWATVLHKLKLFSMEFKNPLELVEVCLGNVDGFVRKALGDKFYNTFHYKGAEAAVERGIRYANDLAHMSKWEMKRKRVIGGLQFDADEQFPNEPLEDF